MTKAHQAFRQRVAKRMANKIAQVTIDYFKRHPYPFPVPSFEVPRFTDSLRMPSTGHMCTMTMWATGQT